MNQFRKIRRKFYKALALVMSLVLTMSLLCGCRSEAQNAAIPTDGMNLVGDTTNIDASTTGTSIVSDETTKDIQLINTDLGELTKAEDTAIEKLSDALAMRDMEQSQAAISELAESLSEAEEITGEWLTLQEQAVEEIKPEISDSGNAILTQRAEKLRNEINEKQEQTKAAVEALNQALDSEDFQEAESALESIRTLLQSDSTAQTYGNGNLSENSILYGETTISDRLVLSGDTAINEEIQELAEELGTPLEIYNYLKNTLGYEYYYGSRKGANGTYAACSGNDYDQASLLIGMLRYLGYQAEYVRGTILLEEEPALSLTGADTYEHAADILASAGVPVTKVMQNGEMIELQMEHVWVRACLPYTDYRGAGNAGGEAVWIDLDTSIKTYEEVENIYDIAEEMNLPEGLSEAVENGNEETIEAVLKDFEAEVEAMELEEVYARKRIIRKEIVSYLPASLQYEVKKELATFTEIGNTDKDSIRFDVGGESLGAYNASDLAGKSILLTFLPASTADAEILSSYDSIFDVPASYVYVKPALLLDGEVVCEAEDVEITLGTAQTCTITLNRAGNVSDKTIQNPVTAGSMYAVTIDNQTITGDELRNSYNQVAVLTETVNEANVYGPEYLGQYLALAGKLYFAQVDLYNIQSGEVYGVSNTRLLSAGITGYEVQRNSRYGIVTSLSPGSMYIDIDADDHAVISLTGDKEIAKAYTMSSGIMSSLYESIVWEQLTGYESVSTISIFRKAKEEGIELLQITKDNLETQLEKLNTDDVTKQAVRNAVGNGNMVTIPAADVTIGEWSGTGYIIMDESGAGSYMITGGLNGGEIPIGLTAEVIVSAIMAVLGTKLLINTLSISILATMHPVAIYAVYATVITLVTLMIVDMYCSYYDYIFTGDMESYNDTENRAFQLFMLAEFELLLSNYIFACFALPYLNSRGAGTTSGSASETRYDKSSLQTLSKTENFSDTAIEHIFEGQVNRRGSAVGYHYEMVNGTNGSIIPGTQSSANSLGVYRGQVQVNGIIKSGNGGFSTFFPRNMSPQEVVNAINEAYVNRVFVSGNRYSGLTNTGMEIEMFLDSEGKIISAYPIY